MAGHKIRMTGYRLQNGKLVRNARQLDVSARIRQRTSKRVKVRKPLGHGR
jgi:hypothetical protein